MAKINFTETQPNGKFTFNLQDRTDRPAGEILKSVTFEPRNANGETKTIEIGKYYWQRGALNACRDYWAGLINPTPGLHLYTYEKSLHQKNGFGWILRSKLQLPANGSPLVHCTAVLNGHVYDIELPHKRLNDKAVVNVDGLWLTLVKMGENTLIASNSIKDFVTGQDFGMIKHELLDMLAAGVTITIPVTLQEYYGAKDSDGKSVVMDNLQRKALELRDLVDMAKDDFLATRSLILEMKGAIASNAQVRKQADRFYKANGGQPTLQQRQETKAQMVLTVKKADGSIAKVAADELPTIARFYRVVGLTSDGKPNEKVVHQWMFDASTTSPVNIWSLKSGQIAFVAVGSTK